MSHKKKTNSKKHKKYFILIGIIAVILLCGAVYWFVNQSEEQTSKENEYVNNEDTIKNSDSQDTGEEELPPQDDSSDQEPESVERTIQCLDEPESKEEEMVLASYTYEIEEDYEKLAQLYDSTEEFKIMVENEKENAKKGECVQSYVIHELKSTQIESSEDPYLQEVIDRKDYQSYSVVSVSYSMQWSETALEQAPQYDSGTYQREILCGFDGEEWKICGYGLLEGMQ